MALSSDIRKRDAEHTTKANQVLALKRPSDPGTESVRNPGQEELPPEGKQQRHQREGDSKSDNEGPDGNAQAEGDHRANFRKEQEEKDARHTIADHGGPRGSQSAEPGDEQ